jgi:NADPH2:quinone reductase
MPRHVICRELGEPEGLHLEQFESKPLAAGQVRVAVRAAGLNYVDVLTIAGKYQHKPPLPFVPGTEAAGDVTEVASDVTDFSVGDRVMLRGGYTEEVVAPVRDLKRLPSTFDYAQGATFLAGHGTAYYGLVDRAQIKPGETLLVHGAAGGVGLAAVELGKAYGATVIAVFDPVGGKVFEESVRCINWGARLVIVGFLQGVGLAQTNLVLIKNASVLGIRAGEAVRRNPALGPPRQRDLMRLAEEGRISPNISHRLPLENWVEAMRLLIDRKAIGRVALVMERQ